MSENPREPDSFCYQCGSTEWEPDQIPHHEGNFRCTVCGNPADPEQDDLIRALLATAKGECRVPPPGWRCTRGAGHDGPCAAIPSSPPPVPSPTTTPACLPCGLLRRFGTSEADVAADHARNHAPSAPPAPAPASELELDDDHGEAHRLADANRLYAEHERRAGRDAPFTAADLDELYLLAKTALFNPESDAASIAMLIKCTPERVAQLVVAARAGAEDTEVARRQWALANVRATSDRSCAEHGDDYDPDCAGCAYHVGRLTGHVEAGAYYTHDEAMALLAARASRPTEETDA